MAFVSRTIIMLQNTSQKSRNSMKWNWFYLSLIVLTLKVGQSQEGQLENLQCLLESSPSRDCIQMIDVGELFGKNPEISVLVCPLLIKYYENEETPTNSVYEKINRVCKISTHYSQDNGYLLLGLYLMEGKGVEAIKLQYNLFFNNPFHHQQKLEEIIVKFHQYLFNNNKTQDSQISDEVTLLSHAVRLLYLNQSKKSLQMLSRIKRPFANEQLNIYYFLLKARLLEKEEEYPTVLQVVTEEIKKKKNNAHWYLYHLKGNMLMHHLKFKAALDSFDKAILMKNQNEQFFVFSLYNAGLCSQKINDHKNALKYLKKAILVNPTSIEILNALGLSYYSLMSQTENIAEQKENATLAKSLYEQAIKINPHYYLTYHNYGTLKFDTKNYNEAVEMFNKSLMLNQKNSSSTQYGLFKSLYQLNKNQAISYLNNEILQSRDRSLVDIGQLLYQLGQYKLAQQYLQKAVEEKSKLGEVYQWKGVVEYELGLHEEAEKSFRKALQKGNTKTQIWFNLGYIEQQKGNYERAAELYIKAVSKDPIGPAKERLELIRKYQKETSTQL